MSVKNDVTYLLTRRQAAVGIFIYLFSCFWMFFLGVLIGRHTLPFQFSTLSFQKELTEIEMSQNKSVMEAGFKPSISTPKLDLFDDMKKREASAAPKVAKIKNESLLPSKNFALAEMEVEKKPAPPPQEKTQEVLPEQSVSEPSKPLMDEEGLHDPEPPDDQDLSSSTLILPEESKFTIQVASLKSSQSADRLVEALKDKGYPAYRAMRLIPEKGTWFRIRVGGFPSKEKAEKMYDQLKKELEPQRILPLIMQQ